MSAVALTKEAKDQLASLMALTPGDVVEVNPLMGGLTQESTLFQVESASPEAMVFRITFFGVRIGKRTLTKSKRGDFKWK